MDFETELAYLLFVHATDGHPFARVEHWRFSTSVDDIHTVAFTPGDGNWIEETVSASGFLSAYGVTVSKI